MSEHDCGHRCCEVRDNPAHTHTQDVGDCMPCAYSDEPVDQLEAVREAKRRLEENRK